MGDPKGDITHPKITNGKESALSWQQKQKRTWNNKDEDKADRQKCPSKFCHRVQANEAKLKKLFFRQIYEWFAWLAV